MKRLRQQVGNVHIKLTSKHEEYKVKCLNCHLEQCEKKHISDPNEGKTLFKVREYVQEEATETLLTIQQKEKRKRNGKKKKKKNNKLDTKRY